MSSDALLEMEGLCKSFRRSGGERLLAVSDLSLSVYRGDIFGFLGPNGAGKSTILRMALGLIHPNAGRVAIAGHDLHFDRLGALRKVGAFVEAPSFYNYLSGRKNLEIFASLSGKVSADDIERTLALVGLNGRENDPVKVYSHGMRARLGIASCLLPRPELMILDEPTDGLDPHGIREMRELIQHLARHENLTVVLSSHLLREVENLCNRIAILEKGRVILQGELAQLERQHRGWQIEVERAPQALALLKAQFGVHELSQSEQSLLLTLNGHASAEINAALVSAGFQVQALAPESGWLDRLFLSLTTSRESARRQRSADSSGTLAKDAHSQ